MFTVPDMPYPYNALEPYIDEKTMRIHHGKHHAGYVQNLNDALSTTERYRNATIEEILTNIDIMPEPVRMKVRNNAGGHANHSLFWTSMAPNSGKVPQGTIAHAIENTFGSFSTFREKFSQAAIGRFGSGWAWLVVHQGTLAIVDTPNQDSPLSQGKIPILGLDVWEHAYYLKYQNMRADYVAAWWNVVDWKEVQKRFAAAV